MGLQVPYEVCRRSCHAANTRGPATGSSSVRRPVFGVTNIDAALPLSYKEIRCQARERQRKNSVLPRTMT